MLLIVLCFVIINNINNSGIHVWGDYWIPFGRSTHRTYTVFPGQEIWEGNAGYRRTGGLHLVQLPAGYALIHSRVSCFCPYNNVNP